jgi:peptide/nickel transport system permease protein
MNWSFRIGFAGIILLLAIAVIGPDLAPYGPEQLEPFRRIIDAQGRQTTELPPFGPSAAHLLGTDMAGRDILSMLLHGAHITLLFAAAVTVGRFFLSIPLAVAASQFPKTIGWAVEKLSLLSTTIPLVLLVYSIAIIYNHTANLTDKTTDMLFTGTLILVMGVFPCAHYMRELTDSALASPFMEGVRLIGSGRWWTLKRHVIPYLTTPFVVLFVTEMAQTLWIVAQLGVLSVFLGGASATDDQTFVSNIPYEWAGAVGTTYNLLRYKPMVFLYPALAMAIAIFTLHLLADGIRKQQNRKWGSI